MKKKIKDLTLEECKKICHSSNLLDDNLKIYKSHYDYCSTFCPLFSDITKSCMIKQPLLKQDLEKEVEVDE